MGLEYKTNIAYQEVRPLTLAEVREDCIDQIKEIKWYQSNWHHNHGQELTLDTAAMMWIKQYGREWRNRRNYERFYKD